MSANQSTPKSGSSALFYIVVVVLLAIIGYQVYVWQQAPKQVKPVQRPEAARNAIKNADQTITTFGASSAPIKIKFYAPLALDWHKKTIGLLRDYNKKNPGVIFVTLMPMGNSKCDDEMNAKGYPCATILINDLNDFTLPKGRKVTLTKRPNTKADSFYNSEDVITIIDQMSKKK
jgi:hypothetical protein